VAYLNSYRDCAVLSGSQLLIGGRELASPSTPNAISAAYRITNAAQKTVFSTTMPSTQLQFSMRRFEDFQANLLENYGVYCSYPRQEPRTPSGKPDNVDPHEPRGTAGGMPLATAQPAVPGSPAGRQVLLH
jgi:hypothetical protein